MKIVTLSRISINSQMRGILNIHQRLISTRSNNGTNLRMDRRQVAKNIELGRRQHVLRLNNLARTFEERKKIGATLVDVT
jgi:hypothetical protein